MTFKGEHYVCLSLSLFLSLSLSLSLSIYIYIYIFLFLSPLKRFQAITLLHHCQVQRRNKLAIKRRGRGRLADAICMQLLEEGNIQGLRHMDRLKE